MGRGSRSTQRGAWHRYTVSESIGGKQVPKWQPFSSHSPRHPATQKALNFLLFISLALKGLSILGRRRPSTCFMEPNQQLCQTRNPRRNLRLKEVK